jgi:ribosome-binding factor A
MKNKTRMTRINEEIQRETAEIIRSELKDPRIAAMTSVMRAETTADLKYCKIYVSVLGGGDQQQEAAAGLKNAAGFIRKLLAERINLRNTPELKFVLDDSLEYSFRMSKLISEVNKPTEESQ